MSIIFIVLGLGFLAGGAYAVVEGWPYLLIERGFTLVIIGTVLMTAGVVMLALSRVMVELRCVRGQLSNAVMAVSVASLANARDAHEPAPGAALAAPAGPVGGSRAGPAAIGGAVAAGGVLAAVAAASRDSEPKEQPETRTEDAAREDEPDLFAAPIEPDDAATPEPWSPSRWTGTATASEAQAEPEIEPGRLADARPAATPDEFGTALIEARGEAEPEPAPDEPRELAEPIDPEPAAREITAPPSVDEDFDLLRDRLALGGERAWDGDAAPTLAGERRDLAESKIDTASDWMTAVRPGQERWFAGPLAPGPEIAPEPESAAERLAGPPVWPPQAREAAPFEPAATTPEPDQEAAVAQDLAAPGDEVDPGPEPALIGPDADSEREPHPIVTPAPEATGPEGLFTPEPEAPSELEAAEPPAPAASDEGVVGAYQVGTAHFTIYADGSIQARTPEGDYSFASMDELKTYLASEKNRLNA